MEASKNSSLLLRLFESDFFDIRIAVTYLKVYPSSIGITHYLINRLKQFSAAEVEFYWPQLCYLLITRPTPSVALENFILERCEEDCHVSVVTLWYLQSSLSDLSINPSTPQFIICHRLFNKVQALVFTDPQIPTSSGFSLLRKKEKVNAPLAFFIGSGIMAASVFGMPKLADLSGPMAIEQGRRIVEMEQMRAGSDDDNSISGSEDEEESVAPVVTPSKIKQLANGILKSPPASPSKGKQLVTKRRASKITLDYAPGARIEATPPSPFPVTLHQTQSQPYLSSTTSSPSHSPFRSTTFSPPISKSLRKNPPVSSSSSFTASSIRPSVSTTNLSISELPNSFLSHLLRLQAARSQLDLLRSLQDISSRLVVVPKPARLSSLRAELTVLNHGLPRGCCLGMACKGSSSSSASKKSTHPHDRIVRIDAGESVALNSADRVPFVIYVEVLEGDLDFNPERRQNSEDLRRALKERETGVSGGFMDRVTLETRKNAGRMSLESGLDGNRVELNPVKENGAKRVISPLAPTLPKISIVKTPEPESMDEMDLVEQLYGDISLRSVGTVVTPKEVEIQNRQVDENAWSSDLPSRAPSPRPISNTSPPPSRRPSLAVPGQVASPQAPPRNGKRAVFSLDDYAERMRMAAIMLAQLNASEAAAVSVVATGSAAAGTLVLLPVAAVTGLGGVVGGVVGAGIGAVVSIGRLPFARTNSQAGQASTGISVNVESSPLTDSSSFVVAPAVPSKSLIPSAGVAISNERPRVLSSIEATAIRNRIMGEMMALEEERMERMKEDGRLRAGWTAGVEDEAVVMRAVNKDDPSGAVFRESFADKIGRIRAASPYGHLQSWNVISVIVKTGADLRQEQLAIQLVNEFGRIWKEEENPCWVRYFRILVTSESSGLIETITDAVSIHSIKKDAYARTAVDGSTFTSFSLYDHYVETFGHPNSSGFRKAQDCFIKSLASYSVICYLLQLKDRHNGNILVDRDGHLIHIDFGFLLSNSPGSLGFEMAPFKLPQDYLEILGGFESEKFIEFKNLFKQGFRDARKHAERIITLVELMQKGSNLPCFDNGELTSQQLRERFQLSLTQTQVEDFVDKLILSAAMSTFTKLYDLFQYHSNGIL